MQGFSRIRVNVVENPTLETWLINMMKQVYNLETDAKVLKQAPTAENFREFRQQYQYRLECSQGIIDSKTLTSAQKQVLLALGFTLQ
jgi:hypothetical protein